MRNEELFYIGWYCRDGHVSLRLGPLAVLTVHRTVIHCRSCRFATRPRMTDGRPYEFYTTWIGIVGADIIRPFLWYLRWSILRAAGCRPYGFYMGWYCRGRVSRPVSNPLSPRKSGLSITKFAQKIVIFSRFFVVVKKNDEKIVDFGVFHQITHFSTLVFHNRCVKRGKVVLTTPHFGGK